MLSPDRYLDQLRADVAVLSSVADDQLGVPVAAGEGWDVTELLNHCASIAAYVTAQLQADAGAAVQQLPPLDYSGDPRALWAEWSGSMLELLSWIDPADHRPNWAGEPTVAFWFRRMAQEMGVHRWDLDNALGRTRAIPVDLALDGVDEFGELFLRFAKDRGIGGTGETIHLHATFAEGEEVLEGGEWMFRFDPDVVTMTHEHGKGDMAVRGAANDLLLFVWNRRPIEVTTFGDTDPLEWWAANVRV